MWYNEITINIKEATADMNDLEDIAMDALDREEQQVDSTEENAVEGSESDSNEQIEENGSDTKSESESGSESEIEANNEDSDNGEGSEGEKDEDPKEKESAEDKKEEKKEELSDEEFEKLAKERGYSKKDEEEAKKAASEDRQRAFDDATKRPKEVDRDTWESMPAINKVIYNNLPYIQAVGKDGNIIRVKTAQQLPDDFEFANKKAEMQFQNDLQSQEMKAQRMHDAINERISQNEQQRRSANEARAILGEISALQKSGDLPTPKAKAGTKDFDEDEAVILINKVLGYRQERMKAGSMLSVEDALTIYKAKHPNEFKSKSEARGDIERKNIANKISGNNKSADTSINAKKSRGPKYYRYGMSMEDVLDRALDEMDD